MGAMTNVCFGNPASLTIRSILALPVKWGTWNLPSLIASTLGSVDQTKCLTPASLAARTAAIACLSSSVPSSQKLVTRNMPGAPSNAALRVSGRFKSASTTSAASSRCLPGLRVSARTLNWPLACRARTTAPPCCPVAPITAISFLLLDHISIPFFVMFVLIIFFFHIVRSQCVLPSYRLGDFQLRRPWTIHIVTFIHSSFPYFNERLGGFAQPLGVQFLRRRLLTMDQPPRAVGSQRE